MAGPGHTVLTMVTTREPQGLSRLYVSYEQRQQQRARIGLPAKLPLYNTLVPWKNPLQKMLVAALFVSEATALLTLLFRFANSTTAGTISILPALKLGLPTNLPVLSAKLRSVEMTRICD